MKWKQLKDANEYTAGYRDGHNDTIDALLTQLKKMKRYSDASSDETELNHSWYMTFGFNEALIEVKKLLLGTRIKK